MRGEKADAVIPWVGRLGSSPLARGKVSNDYDAAIDIRIIPACAGKRDDEAEHNR